VPYDLQVNILKFNCRPEYLPELAKWFTAVSQANNHTDNNGGSWGLEQTRSNLQAAGIQYFSTYDMTQTNDLCEVVTLPAKTTRTHKTVSVPVAMCGYMYVVDVPPTDAQLAVMQQYAKVMPVFAMPHMGVEYRATGEAEKISAYHRMIDNGADIVIGAHPHVIQNSENYKGRLIAYSLGNFLFDQQRLGHDTSVGLAVDLRLTIADADAAKVYESVAPTCKAYKDDCLAELTAKLPARPKIEVSYGYQCYDETGGVPTLGSDAVCAEAKRTATVDSLGDLSTVW
jgi:poly-gamma-glutamate synthesis protein (capsule biosynthesis protein)